MAHASRSKVQEFRDLFETMRPQLSAALPRHLDADRMIKVALTTIQRSPALLGCTPASVLAAVMQACQLGLEPDGVLGHAFLVPHGTQCHLIVGYRGIIDLARRSAQLAMVTAHCVYEHDIFDYELGLEPRLRHVPFGLAFDPKDLRKPRKNMLAADHLNGALNVLAGKSELDTGEALGAYAVIKATNGAAVFDVMTRRQIERIRAMSKSGTKAGSPWVDWWDEMAKKTVLKRAMKYAPVSVEDRALAHALTTDDREFSGLEDVINLEPREPEEKPEPEAAPKTKSSALDALVDEQRRRSKGGQA